MELDNVDVSEIIFKEQISKREYCVVYLVTIRGRACAMKVVSSGTLISQTIAAFWDISHLLITHNTMADLADCHSRTICVRGTFSSASRRHIDA
jgi:hypothetical protein